MGIVCSVVVDKEGVAVTEVKAPSRYLRHMGRQGVLLCSHPDTLPYRPIAQV